MSRRTSIPRGHFAAMLSAAMDELDLSSVELSKQLHISSEHARRLCTGETLPSRLLVEKTAVAAGMPVQELQLAVQRDRMRKNSGSQTGAGRRSRISLFEPLINALDPAQLPAAYAVLERLVKSNEPMGKPGALRPRKEGLEHRLREDKKQKKKVCATGSFRNRAKW